MEKNPLPSPPDIEDKNTARIEAEILVHRGEELLTKYSITHGEYLIGRDLGAQMNLDVDGVSRRHARLIFQGYELLIEDLDSSNGVFIEGMRISLPTRVRPDQHVGIGSATLSIRLKEHSHAMLAASLWDPDLNLSHVRALLEGKKYKVLATIGGGGMGIVHEARDLRIRRRVAMKVIKTSSQFSRENMLRFVDEAQLTGQLQHPNIVPVYDLALDEQDEVFYTMKYVKGTTLDTVLRGLREGDSEMVKKYPLAALITVFQKICDAVAYAHSMGVVHRDLKPDNVMIGEYGEVLVMDWGLAKKIAHGSQESTAESVEKIPSPVETRGFETLNGLVVGTPPYIAPEAARGEIDRIEPRSDIYVLGGILYAILTLHAPYPGREFAPLIEQIIAGKFPHPSSFNTSEKTPKPSRKKWDGNKPLLLHLPGRRVPEGLAAVVIKAMSYEQTARYQNVGDLQEEITAWQSGFAPKAERAGLKRQIILWVNRHKTNVAMLFAFGLISLAALVFFFLSLKHERDSAQRSRDQLSTAMIELQGAAPLFAQEAHDLVKRGEFDRALDRVERAIRQLPNVATYHNLRGNILQTMLRWEDAIEAYESALDRDPNLKASETNRALTRHLVGDNSEEHEITSEALVELQKSLLAQGRISEATSIQQRITAGAPRAVAALQKALENDPAYASVRELFSRREFRGRFISNSDGTYTANFRGLPYFTIIPFFKTPPSLISGLVLDEVRFPSLAALETMKLTYLSVAGCRAIRSLSPIQKMPLERLNISRTNISDLAPLADLPLKELNLEDCGKLTDLRPLLKCKQLEALLLPKHIQDVGYLRELKNLKFIGYKNLRQPAVDFWKTVDATKKPPK